MRKKLGIILDFIFMSFLIGFITFALSLSQIYVLKIDINGLVRDQWWKLLIAMMVCGSIVYDGFIRRR